MKSTDSKKISIIFFGTPDFAMPALDVLAKAGYGITVVTQPDRPTGRKQVLTPPPVKTRALELELPVLQPATLKEDGFFEEFKKINPDVCVVVAYGNIIPDRYLALPRLGFLNIHPSLLPKYRGPSPIQSALLDGEKETGISIILLDSEVDHGPILSQSTYQVPEKSYYPAIAEDLSQLGAGLLADTLSAYASGSLKPREQDHAQATFTKKLESPDGRINWSEPADRIFNRIRALNPEPGTWTSWNGQTLKILEAEPLPFCLPEHRPVGTVFEIQRDIAVQTGDCPISLVKLQLEGAKPLITREFIGGRPKFIGGRLV